MPILTQPKQKCCEADAMVAFTSSPVTPLGLPPLEPGSVPLVSSFPAGVRAHLSGLSVSELVAILVAKRVLTISDLETL